MSPKQPQGEIVGERIVNGIGLAAFVVFGMFTLAGFIEIEMDRMTRAKAAGAQADKAPGANAALTQPAAFKKGPDGRPTGPITIPLAQAFIALKPASEAAVVSVLPARAARVSPGGAELFAARCARCHGSNGEGGAVTLTLSERLGARAEVPALSPKSPALASSSAFVNALTRPWIDDRLEHAPLLFSQTDWSALYAYTASLAGAPCGPECEPKGEGAP